MMPTHFLNEKFFLQTKAKQNDDAGWLAGYLHFKLETLIWKEERKGEMINVISIITVIRSCLLNNRKFTCKRNQRPAKLKV